MPAGLALLAPGTASVRLIGAEAPGSPVDDLLSSCLPAAEIAAIDADLDLSFEGDPFGGPLVCTAAEGSANLTFFEERACQALRVMKTIDYAVPLPWTDDNLYDWLTAAIDGIRFRDDIQYSFCCQPAGVINIASPGYPPSERWINPSGGVRPSARFRRPTSPS
jgi:hypothetical protein